MASSTDLANWVVSLSQWSLQYFLIFRPV